MNNENPSSAKSAKNDEFCAQYVGRQKEVNIYLEYDAEVFRGNVVVLSYDDPEWLNFNKFFSQSCDRFELNKFISIRCITELKNMKPIFRPSMCVQGTSSFGKKLGSD